jgi:signal transduction histidine kinase
MLLLFGGGIYYILYNYSYSDFYKRLETRASIATEYTLDTANSNSESIKILRDEYLEKLTNEAQYIYEILDKSSIVAIADSSSLPLSYINKIYQEGKANLQTGNIFYSGLKHMVNDKNYIVIVSAENYYSVHHLAVLKNIIIAGILLMGLIIVLLSMYFSKYIFKPIRNITTKVKKISTSNIHLRLDQDNKNIEINELILTFNNLLNRLETAFETQKNFISNASHEFGTPITSIMGEAEVSLMKERSTSEYQQSLKSILSQSERLREISQSLLFLAQTGYKENSLDFEIIRADELLWQAKEIIDKINPKNNIEIDFSLLPENPKKLKIPGNKQLLILAFSNILTNACKYSYNKPVRVSLASADTHVLLIFKDQGVGIPELEMQFIYDPFYRASNTHHFEGYGIGLPLTYNIIKIHNGELLVSSIQDKGTIVQIRLPLAKI